MQLVSNAYSVSRELYQLVDAIRNAPTHITAMAQDIQSLYLVLGSLQGLLADLQKLSPLPGILPILESLQQPLSHCLFALDQLQQKLDKYSRPASDAVATANLANTSQNVHATQSLEQQLHAMRIQIEEMRQDDREFGKQYSIEPDSGSQATDRFFALNRFLEATESIFSESPSLSRRASSDSTPVMEGEIPAPSLIQNIQTDHPRKTLVTLRTFTGHSGFVWSVAFSPNGALIASVSNDMTVRLWDTTTGSGYKVPVLLGHSGPVRVVRFSPDGKLVASGSDDKTVRIWEIDTGRTRWTLKGHADWVRAVSFTQDGRFVATTSMDMVIKLWDLSTGSVHAILDGHSGCVREVTFSPDGSLIASASDDMTVRLWESTRGSNCRILRGHSDRVRSVSFSPDGKLVASGSKDKTIRLWDTTTGSTSRKLEGHSSWVRVVAFSLDGKKIASASDDMTVRLWDVATGSTWMVLGGHSGWVRALYFSDKNLVLSASDDTAVQVCTLMEDELHLGNNHLRNITADGVELR
ncbi:hypothetical protein AbraIFM66951_007569 [Aspergillus brasiliensis]|uniref:WD40 repeat-like protein n=1 Tax=Aspergillus brasiliensis TaxID=319629 RepID=A0A9W5YW48_9EURO|nr:hypothetical protein AbraCBS73388_009928 [Aspergillus brasiliensis]GKZ41015.1 hypothetical protein AbraIFM66951_007569 [Aspergillus brasiliensis]